MLETLGPVTNEFLLPAEERSAGTNRRMTYLMLDVIGRGRRDLYRKASDGILPEDTADEIDKFVFGSLKRRYHLPDRTDLREFYLQQQKHAIDVVDYFGEILPDVARDLELKDEISLLSDKPTDLIRLIFRPPASIDPVLAYEVGRHIYLSHISGMIHARTLNGRLRTRLSDVHHLLNEKLFEGPEGAGEKYLLKSYHDDDTNEVVGFPDGSRRPLTAHLKVIPLTVRRIDGELIYTSPRKKNDRVAILKAIAKAQNNNGVINVDGDVQDPTGMMFVPIGNGVTPDQLADSVVSVIESDSRSKVEKVEDDQLNTDRGQSPRYKHTCRRIWFRDVPAPLDLIFQTRENYLNSILEVGTRNPETGLYEGRAHPLFERRRARKVESSIFPPKVYPIDIDTAFVNSSRLKAQELRSMYK